MNYEDMDKDQLIKRLISLDNDENKLGLRFKHHEDNAIKQLRDNIPLPQEDKNLFIGGTGPNNIVLEGDNFHSLVNMVTIGTKVDVIYIDPPYNTGNKDFIYNDHCMDPDDEFRHSKWLSFMKPRLKMARKLLKDDGVIFISIGKEELANLTVLCDKVFNERNRIAIIPRVTKKGGNRGTHFSPSVDYVLAYAKCIEKVGGFKTEVDAARYTKQDDKGKYLLKGLYQTGLNGARPNCRYYIECPDGSLCIPPGINLPTTCEDGCALDTSIKNDQDKFWKWSRESYLQQGDEIVITKSKKSPLVDENGNKSKWNVYNKVYLHKRMEKGNIPPDVIDGFYNTQGTKEVAGMGLDFSYPKPTKLIEYLISITDKQKDITVLDFFAGSGTTGHAVLNLNKQDGGDRRFILCTNNENGICENVTRKRLKMVIDGYTNINDEHTEGTGGSLRYFKIELYNRNKMLTEDIIEGHGKDLIRIHHDIFSVCDDSTDDNISIHCDKHACLAFLDDIFEMNSLKLIGDLGITEWTTLMVGSADLDSGYIKSELSSEGYSGFVDVIAYPTLYSNKIKNTIAQCI